MNIEIMEMRSQQSNVPPNWGVAPQELQHAIYEVLVGESPDTNDTNNIRLYMNHLTVELTSNYANLFLGLLHSEFKKYCPPTERMIWAIVESASLLRSDPTSSIDGIVEKLAGPDNGTLAPSCMDENRALARYLIFCIEGWITLLYHPLPPQDVPNQTFEIDHEEYKAFQVTAQPQSQSSRPLQELLSVFGIFADLDFSTSAEHEDLKGKTDIPQSLFPSLLDASILTTIGGLEICWVDSISLHLHLTPSKQLCLFRMPSFLYALSTDDSILQVILNRLYEEDDTGGNLNFAQLAGEAIQSYRLIFDNSAKSRALYRSRERHKSKFGSPRSADWLLDDLCGYNVSRFSLRSLPFATPLASVDASVHFPMLGRRLMRLQRFIESRQARGLRALYYDHRNSYQWWTFWAVIWLGAIGLLLSFTQTVLAAVQVAYAVKSYSGDCNCPGT